MDGPYLDDLKAKLADISRQIAVQDQRLQAVLVLLKPASPYLTAEEAAAYCKVKLRTLYNNRRYIEAVRRGRRGRLLFKKDALDKWVSSTTKLRGPRHSR